jgi:hypothetical protein
LAVATDDMPIRDLEGHQLVRRRLLLGLTADAATSIIRAGTGRRRHRPLGGERRIPLTLSPTGSQR